MEEKKRPILRKTSERYGDHSSIHGIGYIFDSENPHIDRVFWSAAVFLFMLLAVHLSMTTFTTWQHQPVFSSLDNTELPMEELDFPSVTICREGLDMDNVGKTMVEDFKMWREGSTRRAKRLALTLEEELEKYMEETFDIRKDDPNMMDVLSSMTAPNVDTSVGVNAVREAAVASKTKNSLENKEIKLG